MALLLLFTVGAAGQGWARPVKKHKKAKAASHHITHKKGAHPHSRHGRQGHTRVRGKRSRGMGSRRSLPARAGGNDVRAERQFQARRKALKDPHAAVRGEAALALGRMGAAAEPAVPELAAALKDRDASVRESAAGALGQIGPAAHAAVWSLRESLTDPKTGVRWAAAEALGRLTGPQAVAALIWGLKNKDEGVRALSAEGLGRMGPAAHAAESSLELALKDPDSNVRARVRDALQRVRGGGR